MRRIDQILGALQLGDDGIYSSSLPANSAQADEVRQRAAVARRAQGDLLAEVSRHHSVRVMDREAAGFLRRLPPSAAVIDIGAGWGWHWRRLEAHYPGVTVCLVDFVRENLRHAARLLEPLVNRRVFLVHGDATDLPFPASVFDGCWTVQAFQHVPNLEDAVREASRVLRPGGEFACYMLNRAAAIEHVYRVVGKEYQVRGTRAGSFFLERGSPQQARVVARVFDAPVTTRYTEVLFHPDLGLRTGNPRSWIGAIDATLSGGFAPLAWVARQRSYHVRKPS